MRILLLLLLAVTLFAEDDLAIARSKITEPVVIIFQLTIVNKDKNTKEIATLQQTVTLKDWEKAYRPLTLLELKTYGNLGYIKALPVILIIRTI